MNKYKLHILFCSLCLSLHILPRILIAAEPEPREWASADGKFKIEATLKDYLVDDKFFYLK